MQNIIAFIVRYYLTFLFLLFELLSLTLVILFNQFQNSLFVNSSNEVVGNFYAASSSVKDYFNLKQINQRLVDENAALRGNNPGAFYDNSAQLLNFKDSSKLLQYSYIPARVINNSVTRQNNFITLNKGRAHGISKGMGVISPEGAIGSVVEVSEHFSLVISLLNQSTRIPGKVEKTGHFGSLGWDGMNPRFMNMSDVNKFVPIQVGQKIVTSGYSTVFPEGIEIGTVESFEIAPGGNFFDIKVRLSARFDNVSEVYVISNFLKQEQETLEAQTPKTP